MSLTIDDGETLGLVGESGCGKTTVGNLILALLEPTAGRIRFLGEDIFSFKKKALKHYRRNVQMIFQEASASLNPKKTIREIISYPLLTHGIVGRNEIEKKVSLLLEQVDLSPADQYMDRFPHELSGGQCQRVGIARAISTKPNLIVADEPVSELDMSVRASILNLMKDLQKELKLTYLFITHDLSVVRSICRRVAVMYLGELVELANVEEMFSRPKHPYTQALLSATPIPDPVRTRTRKKTILRGDVPSSIDPPSGCRFRTRCSSKMRICIKERPRMIELRKDNFVACHLFTRGNN